MATGSISLAKAMWRGFRGKCPNCGEGHMFGRFLKVADACDHCGEELFHQRADDFPAYLVMVVVGHLVVPAILAVETAYAPAVWLQLAVWLPVTLFASLQLDMGFLLGGDVHDRADERQRSGQKSSESDRRKIVSKQ